MKWIILCLSLTGCANLPTEDYKVAFEKRANEVTQHFNALAKTTYEIPQIVWTSVPCEAGNLTGEADSVNNIVSISEDCARRFPHQTENDILIHELTHVFVDKFYGAKNQSITQAILGSSDDGVHDFIWQETYLKLGGSCSTYITDVTLISEYCH